jgi:hypothetical protein
MRYGAYTHWGVRMETKGGGRIISRTDNDKLLAY